MNSLSWETTLTSELTEIKNSSQPLCYYTSESSIHATVSDDFLCIIHWWSEAYHLIISKTGCVATYLSLTYSLLKSLKLLFHHLPPLLPGVPGLAYPPRCCVALAGFKIWNEHMRVSSTVIIAPALSNSPQ